MCTFFWSRNAIIGLLTSVARSCWTQCPQPARAIVRRLGMKCDICSNRQAVPAALATRERTDERSLLTPRVSKSMPDRVHPGWPR